MPPKSMMNKLPTFETNIRASTERGRCDGAGPLLTQSPDRQKGSSKKEKGLRHSVS